MAPTRPLEGRRLLPVAWWSAAALSWVASALVLAGLAWRLHRTGSGGRVDLALDHHLTQGLAAHRLVLGRLVALGSPSFVIGASVVLSLGAAALRWGRGAVLGLVGAPLAGAATDLALKPFVTSHAPVGPNGKPLAFPSGHTTGAFAVALVLTVLLLPGRATTPVPALLRLALGVVALGLAAGTAAAMVALNYHRTTDVVGGFATATLVVLAVAAAVDLVAQRRQRR